jgi:putative transposase
MPDGLKRYYGTGHLHFITCSCYDRKPLLDSVARRNLFLTILEQTRLRYRFVVLGYVVMPEHFHLLMSEPQVGDPSKAMGIVKQVYAQRILSLMARGARTGPRHVWLPRFYDFNVWTEHKRVEKLRYMHWNPVTRGLVEKPEEWGWSSFRDYSFGEKGPVQINDTDILTMRVRGGESIAAASTRPLQKPQGAGHPFQPSGRPI